MIKALLFERLRCVKLPAGGGVAPVYVAGPRAAHRFLRLPTRVDSTVHYEQLKVLKGVYAESIIGSIEHIRVPMLYAYDWY